MKPNFYCQRICGEVDFSIDDWHKTQEEIKKLSPEQQAFVKEAQPDCKEQCQSCAAIVEQTRAKNQAIREKNKKLPVGDQPVTPCCGSVFIAVRDYSTLVGQLGLYSHAICHFCNKKYDVNLKPL